MERIAEVAAANKQLIFHYFGSKDGLYAAAVGATFASTPQPASGPVLPPEAVRRQVSDLAAWLERTPGAAVAIAECAPGRVAPADAQALVAAWRASQVSILRQLIDDGQRQGHFRDDVDGQAVAELVIASAVGRSAFGAPVPSGQPGAVGFPGFLAALVVDACAWR